MKYSTGSLRLLAIIMRVTFQYLANVIYNFSTVYSAFSTSRCVAIAVLLNVFFFYKS